MSKKIIIYAFFLLIILTPIILAHEGEVHELPENMKRVQEYNSSQANFYFTNLSFLIAFLAGILSILTPCSLAILPAFFAYSFKEKTQITRMTLFFFLGFMPAFIILALIAAFLGKTIVSFQQDYKLIVMIAGFLIIIFGIMVLLGKGFSFFRTKPKNKNASGIFLFGVLFSIGFSACMGPILVGMLLIATILKSYIYASVLMLFYSIGFFIPLFLISFFMDKYNFPEYMDKLNKKFGFAIIDVIAGLLLLLLGIVFILYGGTSFFTSLSGNLGLGSFTASIYSLQNKIVNLKWVNIIGALILISFIILLYKFLKLKSRRIKKWTPQQ